MKPPSNRRANQALTRLDVVVVIGVLVILAGILLGIVPALRQARAFAQQINCVNNLKNVGLSFRIFAADHGDKWPWQIPENKGGSLEDTSNQEGPWRHFLTLSNELNHPRLLWCPMDPEKRPASAFWVSATNRDATVFSGNGNVSYFLALGSTNRNQSGDQADDILAGDRNVTLDGQPVSAGEAVLRGGHLIGFRANTPHRDLGQLLKADGTVWQQRTRLLNPPASVTNRLLVP